MFPTEVQIDEDEIVRLALRNNPTLSRSAYGPRVFISQLHDRNIVVKYGMAVREQEARNQQYARRNADPNIIYVPEVFAYFRRTICGRTLGFLVMEHIVGDRLDDLEIDDVPNIRAQMQTLVQHLASLAPPRDCRFGPVGSGPVYGYLWSDDGSGTAIDDLQDAEDWMNVRLAIVGLPSISLTGQRLGFRHMDLARRNIILREDHSICLIDWEYAGFYPEVFERSIFEELHGEDASWFDLLTSILPVCNEHDQDLVQRLAKPAVINMKYAIGPAVPNSVSTTMIPPPMFAPMI